jgi:hypothetical protein
MGFFGKILEKLGIKKGEEEAKPAVTPAKPVVAAKPITGTWTGTGKPAGEKEKADVVAASKPAAAQGTAYTPPPPSVPVAISQVDVVKQLEKLSLGKGLDWKISIVDLLKLLDIDSSREARNELATELGCPADLMKDSGKMNIWLHKEVLRKIAQNGGNIPESLLD